MPLIPLYSANINAKERYNVLRNEAVQKISSIKDTRAMADSALMEYPADAFEKQNTAFNNVENLYDEFYKLKGQQGLIGNIWDGIKNLFHLKNGSNYVENIIERVQNGKISCDEADKRLNGYKEGQKMCVDIAGDVISGIAAVGAAALAPVTGGASLFIAAGAGAGVKIAIKAGDSIISGRGYNLSDFGYDVITGSINGIMAPLSNALGGAAGTGVAKAMGLEAVETCAKSAVAEAGEAGVKQAGKSFLAKLLAKQGVSYTAKEGAKGGIALIAAKTAAYGIDMTVDGALSGAADACARAAVEDRIEDMPEDVIQGAFGGAVGGLAIGGASRLIFKAASKLNSKLFGPIKEFASGNNAAKSFETNFTLPNLDDEVKNAINANLQLKAFYSLLDETAISKLTSEQIMQDIADENFIRSLSVDFSNGVKAGSNEAAALAEVIAKRNEYLHDCAFAQFKNATANTDVTYYSRVKSAGSTLDKLNDKITQKSIMSFNEANMMIADGVGTRAIFNSLTQKEALNALKLGGLSADDIQILKYIWKAENINLSETQAALLNRANNLLVEAQTQKFIDRFAKALSDNEISITGIENYAGEGGISYFTEKQIKQLRDAWLESLDAENGKKFKIVTKLQTDGELASDLGFSKEYVRSLGKKSAKSSGYTACQVNFEYKNGALGEGQFRGAEIQQFAEYEHFPYDIKKGKNTVTQKIKDLICEGKTDVAKQLEEYQNLVLKIAKDDNIYKQYNNYLREVYNYLRKKELGILDILGDKAPLEPVLNIKELSGYQNEMLSKSCLESLSKKEFYNFTNTLMAG